MSELLVERPAENVSQTLPSLAQARMQLFSLPGIEGYLPTSDIRALSENDYHEQELAHMVEDVSFQLEAQAARIQISYDGGLSDTKANEFFSHQDRQPFQSQIEFSLDRKNREEQYIIVGSYLRARYTDAKARRAEALAEEQTARQQELEKAREQLRDFWYNSAYCLFGPQCNEAADRYNGISGRHEENIKPTADMKAVVQKQITQVARMDGVDPDKLQQEVDTATEGGNFALMQPFLQNKRGSLPLRHVLEQTILARAQDPSFAAEHLQLLWEVEKYSLAMGIDLEMTYEMFELPDSATIEKRLHDFLTNRDYVAQIWQHLDTEAAPVVTKHKKTGEPMSFLSIMAARAQYHHYPDKAETPQELDAKMARAYSNTQTCLPALAYAETTTNVVFAPTGLGATDRPKNTTYRNKNQATVNIAIVHAREDPEQINLSLVHELGGHNSYTAVLTRAYHDGYAQVRSVRPDLEEDVALLIEKQYANKDVRLDQQKQSTPSGRFYDLYDAIGIRRQAPYALSQQAFRQEMETLWRRGRRDSLTTEEAQAMMQRLRPQIDAWHAEGIPLTYFHLSPERLVNIFQPYDGAIYLGEYLNPAVKMTSSDKPGDMETAFTERFGEGFWLEKPDFWAILLALDAETGKTGFDPDTRGQFILDANLEEIYARLVSWGITKADITPQPTLSKPLGQS